MYNLIYENGQLKERFDQTRQCIDLEKYVISEIQPPIGDYEHSLLLIYHFGLNAVSKKLLIVGGYIETTWTGKKDACLRALNQLIDGLDDTEEAITFYLNALMMERRDYNFKNSAAYKNWLRMSMKCPVNFVNNRVRLARLLKGEKRKAMYEEALRNIQEVRSLAEIQKIPMEHYLNIDFYIQEMILGTRISYVNYEGILKEMNNE